MTPVLNRTVTGIDDDSVTVEDPDGSSEAIPAGNVIWAAGVTASSLATQLAEGSGAELDRAGPDPGRARPDPTRPPRGLRPRRHGPRSRQRWRAQALPGVAPVAMQEGRHAARAVGARLAGEPVPPFHYRDKGNLATIGRAVAVADLHLVRLSGFPAWLTWLVVHLWYLIGFQNRLLVMIRWSVSFFTHGRGARLITSAEADPP